MFERLTDRFQQLKRQILGYGRITTSEIETILRDIRITLLEADVHYQVVKGFTDDLARRAQTLELSRSLTPGDLVLKMVYEELVRLLGGESRPLRLKSAGRTVISLIGLQGVGKTTTAGKLAQRFRDRKVLLVPADAKRPAAAEQLTQIGARAAVPVFPLQDGDAISTVRRALDHADRTGCGLVIVDTAGRLHIDDDLIAELQAIHREAKPDYRLLVADGMAGQDAVRQAQDFQRKVGIDGAILTKMDGDARGGAALSITRAAGVPIHLVGTSEHLDGLEDFHPDRMAQRILGMGDLTTLVEKVQTMETGADQRQLQQKVASGELNLEDFREQMKAVKKLGPLSKLASLLPGIKDSDLNENEFRRIEAIISSMTRRERQRPEIIDGSRKRRIASGSGTTVAEVNQLLKQFFYARDLLKNMARGKRPAELPGRR